MEGLLLLASIVEEQLQARKRRRTTTMGGGQEMEPMDSSSPTLGQAVPSTSGQVGSLWGWTQAAPEQLVDDADSGSDAGSEVEVPAQEEEESHQVQQASSFPGFWATTTPMPIYQGVQS